MARVSPAGRDVSDALIDMETEIIRVAGLAKAIAIMGDRASLEDGYADAVSAVGHTLGEAVERLRTVWSEARALAPDAGSAHG